MKKFLLFLLLLSALPVHADVLDCALHAAKSSIVKEIKLRPEASFEEISFAFKKLDTLVPERNIRLDAKRLINEADWNKAIQSGDANPWITYGEITIADWKVANSFILNLPLSTPASSSLLKNIHMKTSKNLHFHGFEGRRIQKRFKSDLIDKEKFKEELHNAYKLNNEVHGVLHQDLVGVFRSSPYDNLSHSGSSIDKNGRRYFTEEEKKGLIDNKYVMAEEKNFIKVEENHFAGEVKYLDAEKVEKAVDQVLIRAESDLMKAKSLSKVVETIQLMKKDLMSIHPFLDGNGRTIRLLEDFLLRRYNLPPSLFPNESDLVMSGAEATEFTRQHMIKYVNEHAEDFAHNGY